MIFFENYRSLNQFKLTNILETVMLLMEKDVWMELQRCQIVSLGDLGL